MTGQMYDISDDQITLNVKGFTVHLVSEGEGRYRLEPDERAIHFNPEWKH